MHFTCTAQASRCTKGEAVSSILVNLKVSPQHIEVNLSELKGYEKHVIAELIQEKNQKLPITTLQHGRENCKAIIINDADKLSTDASSYIKWMLEKFKGCNKVFFCCRDSAKLYPLKPNCTLVQLLEPSNEEILAVLAFIAKQEGIQLPQKLANQMAKNSKNNLRQAIRSFEATCQFNRSSSLKEDQDIKTGWEDKIADIAQNVIEEQSPKQLYNIRGELQNLIEHNVDPEYLFQNIVEELKKNLPDQLEEQFDNLYNDYQKNQAVKKYLTPQNLQEVEGKRHNDPRKNVQQFMRIEGIKETITLIVIDENQRGGGEEGTVKRKLELDCPLT
ncbi:replication factor C subunit 3-like [Primulina tabacum]|uniref:replication factor C subunit 3-like n=1 Tax=Primulina tabacum TaxID=48773 RepID=UPI003F5AA176